MIKPIHYISCFFIFFSFCSVASEDCLKKAYTQHEINKCTDLSFLEADKELNRVYSEIKRLYKDEPNFLKKLKAAQLAWIKLRDADMDLRYPEDNKRSWYGSSYPMCYSSEKTEITLQRIVFLKKWLKGFEEGNVCSGSIKHSWSLKPVQ